MHATLLWHDASAICQFTDADGKQSKPPLASYISPGIMPLLYDAL